MGFDYSAFCGLTGLHHNKKEKTCFGIMQGGYPVFVQPVSRRDVMQFRLIAKLPFDKTPEQTAAALEQWRMAHSGVSGLIHRDRTLSAVVSLSGKETARAAASVTAELVGLAADLGLIPCCMACGTEQDFSQYLLDGAGVTICLACKLNLESAMQTDTEMRAKQKPRTAGLAIGALAGAAVVFLLTFFVLRQGNLSILTGFAGLAVGLLLMKKLGKKMTVPAVLSCMLLCLIAGCGASVLHLSSAVAESNRENYVQASQVKAAAQDVIAMMDDMDAEELEQAKEVFGDSFYAEAQGNLKSASLVLDNQTTAACLRAFPQFLQDDLFRDELTDALRSYLLCIFLSIGIGTAVTAPKLLHADSGVHRLTELRQ